MVTHPLISICIITYNHEDYILDCLTGVFVQDYPNLEVIISNDSSQDKTDKIIREFISTKSRPGIRFEYFNNVVNLGVSRNFLEAIKKCEGEYIAICEGDDFWFNKTYLSNHYNFLSRTKDYIFSLSKVTYLDQQNNKKSEKIESIKTPPIGMDIDYSMIANGFHIGIQSMMFKPTAELIMRLDGYKYFFDTVLTTELLKLGKGRALDFSGSMYRIQQAGFMSGSNPFFRIRFNFLLFFEIVNKNKSNRALRRRALFLASEYYLYILWTTKYSYLKEFIKISFTRYVSFDFSFQIMKIIFINSIANRRRKNLFLK